MTFNVTLTIHTNMNETGTTAAAMAYVREYSVPHSAENNAAQLIASCVANTIRTDLFEYGYFLDWQVRNIIVTPEVYP